MHICCRAITLICAQRGCSLKTGTDWSTESGQNCAAPWSSRSRVKPRSLFWCAGIGLCQAACMQLHGENIHTIRWIKNKDWVILRNNYVLGNGHNKSCDSLQNPFLKETQRGATNDSITSAQMLKTQDFDVPDFDPDALHKGYRQSTILWLMVRFIKRQSCLNIL